MTTGEKIRKRRLELGIRQKDVARILADNILHRLLCKWSVLG